MNGDFQYNQDELKTIRLNWQEFAELNDGKFNSSLHNSKDRINAPIYEYNILKFKVLIDYLNNPNSFTVSETHPLKVRYDFSKILSFDFIIYMEDIFEKIGKLLGSKDINLNRKVFDNRFIIKGSNTIQVQRFFDDTITEFLIDKDISNYKLGKTNVNSFLEITIMINLLKKGEYGFFIRIL